MRVPVRPGGRCRVSAQGDRHEAVGAMLRAGQDRRPGLKPATSPKGRPRMHVLIPHPLRPHPSRRLAPRSDAPGSERVRGSAGPHCAGPDERSHLRKRALARAVRGEGARQPIDQRFGGVVQRPDQTLQSQSERNQKHQVLPVQADQALCVVPRKFI